MTHKPFSQDSSPDSSEGVSRRDFIRRAGSVASGIALAAGIGACESANFLGDSTAGSAGSVVPAPPKPLAYGPGNPFRLALIGTGGRMNGALLPNILREEHVEIVACNDPSEKRLKSTLDRIEKLKGKRPEGFSGEKDYESLLKREDIHGVFSACPCDLHAAIYVCAMENGKHIYGEKPAAITLDETKALHAAWMMSTTVVQIGFQRRASNRYIEGIALAQSGALGALWDARGAWNNGYAILGNDPERIWLSQRARSGDWMLEQACHTWDVMNWLAGGIPVKAHGQGRRDVFANLQPSRDVTDYYVATLEYPNGMIVQYSHTWFAPKNDNGAFSGVYERVSGLNGGIDFGSGRVSYTNGSEPITIQPSEAEMTIGSVKHFFECVRAGRHPNSSINNGIDASLTGLLVRRAVDERRVVMMDEIVGHA